MSAQDITKLAQTMYDAFNNRDFDTAAALIADDAEWVNVPLGVTFNGPDGYRQFAQSWSTAFPDGKVEVTNIMAGEAGVVVEFRGRGAHTGPLAGRAGQIPATGKSIDVPFCDVLQFTDGKITAGRTYYDAATMMGQLGLVG